MRSQGGRGVAGYRGLLGDADVLLIVPPFAALKYPSLGLHLLQACGRQAGIRVSVFYANLALAAAIGEANYARICDAPMGSFVGERFFCRCAYGSPALGRNARKMHEATWVIEGNRDVEFEPESTAERPIPPRELARLEKTTGRFVNRVAGAIAEHSYRIVGCTTNFEQTSASVALLNRIKRLCPSTVTILGGANCEGEMAEGIASLGAQIDYIFSGEGESSFPKFVRTILAGSRPPAKIIRGELCRDLDGLPTPEYTEFYEQRKHLLPESSLAAGKTEVLFETSRGCWWGQKHHCTFCGLNGEGMAFRRKSPERVIEELRSLARTYPTRKISMTDNILPQAYFKTLLPRLAAELPGLEIFYEVKANLSLSNLLALKAAGVSWVQPGIEALSSGLLKLMKKGVLARQNLMLLRDARASGVKLSWNLLWGFPGDDLEEYRAIMKIIPLLHHLQPPEGFVHLCIDRFSPYFTRPAEFGIGKVGPFAGYYDFLPKTADTGRIAYHFTGDYDCGSHRRLDVICRLWQQVKGWRAAWEPGGAGPREDLCIVRRPGYYEMADTRRVAGKRRQLILQRDEALDLLTCRPYAGGARETWAMDQKLAVVVDGWFVPLVVPDPEMLTEMTPANNVKETAIENALVSLDIPRPCSPQPLGIELASGRPRRA